MIKAKDLLRFLIGLFPDAGCELNYKNLYELCIAVVLSAQTTDKSVNKITKDLFNAYPDFASLAQANTNDVEAIIKSIGLYRTKARHIIALSKEVIKRFSSTLPKTRKDLCSLPGVGRKTANVILSEGYHIPAIAVDTHVSRVSRRLGIACPLDDVLAIEKKCEAFFPKQDWHLAHHLLIFFGRYVCKAQKPDCYKCPFECKERRMPYNP